jgi:hypothetical protein
LTAFNQTRRLLETTKYIRILKPDCYPRKGQERKKEKQRENPPEEVSTEEETKMALPFPPPAALDSSFTMSRPEEADIDAMSQVYYDSFATDPGNTYWWSPDRDAMFEWLRVRMQRKMADRRTCHFQVLDTSSPDQREVVAFARWDIPKGYEARLGHWVDKHGPVDVSRVVNDDDERDEDGYRDRTGKPTTAAPIEEAVPAAAKTIDHPRGADPYLCQDFFAALSALAKKWNTDDMLGACAGNFFFFSIHRMHFLVHLLKRDD